VKVLTDAEYEEQRKQQFMRDVGITEYNVNTFDVATEEYENEYEVDE
jgi:hypothetical protein